MKSSWNEKLKLQRIDAHSWRIPREGPMLTDRLIGPQGVRKAWSNARIDTRHSHGTGCTLASAIATGRGQGLDLIEAVERGRKYVREALALAPGLGAGHGPMGNPFGFHAYA